MNDRIQLNSVQRTYLIRLKGALNTRYSDLSAAMDGGGCPSQYMRSSINLLKKIINNGYYHKSTAPTIKEIAEKYNYLIETVNK